jgi:hypothetical protein
MKLLTKRDKRTALEKEIDDLTATLQHIDPYTDEYRDRLESIERLSKLRDENKKSKLRVSPDTMVVVAGNLAGILLILLHEKLHVISTKALNFVIRGRV